MTLSNYLLGLGLVGIAGTFSGVAFAQTCASDADCVAGYTCKSETVNTATTAPCPPDAECKRTETATPITVSACVPKSCVVDSDCGAGMICLTTTTDEACSGGTDMACEPGTNCVMPDPVCTKITTSQCAYSWQLPCKVDDECGAGFRCQPQTYKACSGSSSMGGATGETPPVMGVGGETGTTVTLDTGAGGSTTSSFAPRTVTSVDTGTIVEKPDPAVDPITVPGNGAAVAVPGNAGAVAVPGNGGAVAVPGNGGAVAVPGSGASVTVPGNGGAVAVGGSTGVTAPGTPTCTTVTQYPGSCVPKATTCATDTDCPSVFVCQEVPTRVTTTGTGGFMTTPTGAPTATSVATGSGVTPSSEEPTLVPVTIPETGTATTAKVCLSPVSGYGSIDLGTKGGIAVPTAGPAGDPNGSTSTGTSRDTGSTSLPPTVTTAAPGTESADSPQAGGCQMGPGGEGPLWGLSLLGLAAFVSRRRRRG